MNDILYKYAVETQVTLKYPDDFKTAMGGKEAAAIGDCEKLLSAGKTAWDALSDAFKKEPALTPTKDATTKKYPSVPLSKTKAAWKTLKSSNEYRDFDKAMQDLKDSSCQFSGLPKQELDMLLKKQEELRLFGGKVDGPHEIIETITLFAGADNEVSSTVTESIADGADKGATVSEKEFSCTLKSDVLSLSAGPLFSYIPNRRYFAETAFPFKPVLGADGAPVRNPDGTPKLETSTEGYKALSVDGRNGIHTTGAALMQYKLPIPKLDNKAFQLHWAAGPTFRMGGQDASASRVGFFSGISVSLWRRLFLTPGIHLGQFADFPTSLAPGSFIPPSYPDAQLTGVKRWSGKFGIALTYRTKTFESLDIGMAKPVAKVSANTPAAAAPETGAGTPAAAANAAPGNPASARAESGPSTIFDAPNLGERTPIAATPPPPDGQPARTGVPPPDIAAYQSPSLAPAKPAAPANPDYSQPQNGPRPVLIEPNLRERSPIAATPAQLIGQPAGTGVPARDPAAQEPPSTAHIAGRRGITAERRSTPAPRETFPPQPVHMPSVVLGSTATFDGLACPANGMKPSYALSPDGGAFSVLWTDFAVKPIRTSSSPEALDCQVRVPLMVPVGYEVALQGADYRGFVEAGGGAGFRMSIQQAMVGSSGAVSSSVLDSRNTEGAKGIWDVTPVAKDVKWSACGEPVTLIFRIQLSASLPTPAATALLTLDSMDFKTSNQKHLQIRACAVPGGTR